LLEREPYFENVAKIMVLSERNHIESYISASAVTDVYYIALKVLASKTRVDETESFMLRVIMWSSSILLATTF
jgi:hypothetical protein